MKYRLHDFSARLTKEFADFGKWASCCFRFWNKIAEISRMENRTGKMAGE